jgi:hypothetical protein
MSRDARPPEMALMAPLVSWLTTCRRLRDDTILVEELPWHGRRIDLAALSRSGITCSYELKVAHNRRAIEQSYLNGIAFDRSYLVTATRLRDANFAQAQALGVGVLYVAFDTLQVSQVLPASRGDILPATRRRLRSAIIRRSETASV